ncbi:hypothetical protein ABD76_00025 [Paenibacillus dendritiformis]|nr:hypothetical protein [Paenibacillus dendritiformis]
MVSAYRSSSRSRQQSSNEAGLIRLFGPVSSGAARTCGSTSLGAAGFLLSQHSSGLQKTAILARAGQFYVGADSWCRGVGAEAGVVDHVAGWIHAQHQDRVLQFVGIQQAARVVFQAPTRRYERLRRRCTFGEAGVGDVGELEGLRERRGEAACDEKQERGGLVGHVASGPGERGGIR